MKNLALFPLIVRFLWLALAQAKKTRNCDLVCPSNNVRQVCGSDGQTYQSKCFLKLKKCTSGVKIHVDYHGPCRAPPSCVKQRRRTLLSIRERGLIVFGIFIPKCNEDGSYSAVQCHQASRVCWCVDRFGQEIEDTRVRYKRPQCRARLPRTIVRLLKGCSTENRINFNKKVVTTFKKEMAKLSKKKGKFDFRDIVQWKMRELDVDKSGYLDHKELKFIIKKFKKAFPPRKCGKTLFYYCDKNGNDMISKREWLTCLGFQGSKSSSRSGVRNCFEERSRVTKLQQKDPKSTRIIPSCNRDGTYEQVQCENRTKYCWCVNQRTGRNIPNTSVRNAKPDCTKRVRQTPAPSRMPSKYASVKIRMIRRPYAMPTKPAKSKKECDESSWARFADKLIRLIRKELESITAAKLRGPTNFFHQVAYRLPDNMVLAWKFSRLDTDRDRLLSAHELFVPRTKKVFGRIQRGRKCSKRLAKACDFDKNGSLSLEEWRDCLQRKPRRGSIGR